MQSDGKGFFNGDIYRILVLPLQSTELIQTFLDQIFLPATTIESIEKC